MKKLKKFLVFLVYFSLFSGAIMAGIVFSVVNNYKKELPSIALLESYKPEEVTQIYSRDGILLDTIFMKKRTNVSLEELPKHISNAFIAIEDKRFYEHKGFDPIRLLGALYYDVRTMSKRQGASTITQQLVRNISVTGINRQRKISRKIKEILLAREVEENYSKDEILEMYLNQIYLGSGNYGIASAAENYFGKKVQDLSIAEAALLAGLPKAPNTYNPRKNMDKSLKRRNVVLMMMNKFGFITTQEYQMAKNEPIVLSTKEAAGEKAPYFVEYVRRQLYDMYGYKRVLQSGWKIYTTLDYDAQVKAEEYYEEQLQVIEHRENYDIQKAPKDTAKIVPPEELVKNGITQYVQGSLVALDRETGAVVSFIGGRDFDDSKFIRPIQSKRPVGSTFKPFVYTTAIRAGYSPSDIIWDMPIMMKTGDGNVWKPQNYSEEFKGAISLKDALAHSVNTVAIELAQKLGLPTVIDLAKSFHIDKGNVKIPEVSSLAIGAVDVPLINMVTAYNVFPNKGEYVSPYIIEKILDRNDNEIYSHQSKRERVLKEEDDFLMIKMLENVMAVGTGQRARSWYKFLLPAGGKTGTNDDESDAYYIGFSKKYTCGVWVGFDELKPMGKRESGAGAALPIWSKYMKYIHDRDITDKDDMNFDVPENIVEVEICEDSGLLPTPYCKKLSKEYFKKGYTPTVQCNIHKKGYEDLKENVIDFNNNSSEDTDLNDF